MRLQSDANDAVGQGQSLDYTAVNSVIAISSNGGRLGISISGDKNWKGSFQLPSRFNLLQAGTFANLQRYPFNDPAAGGMDWAGDASTCGSILGSFTIDSVIYDNGFISSIDLHFEQHCNGSVPALRGQIHWTSTDPTMPPGPVSIPANLWQPAAGATPPTGNYVFLQSDAGDVVGQGQNYLFTPTTGLVTATANGGNLSLNVNGVVLGSGQFRTMDVISQLQTGYYGNLQRIPGGNPTRGGIYWTLGGRGCTTLQGWFAVDSAVYDTNGTLTSIDLRFEQRCNGDSAALRGKIHWAIPSTVPPAGPVTPPANLWQPAAGATPVSGNYVYLQSDVGDYVGIGKSYTFTQTNSVLTTNASGDLFKFYARGEITTSGNFLAMNAISQFQPGYYGILSNYWTSNPAFGGLIVDIDGRACTVIQGWFVVDGATYSNGALSAIDLRFEQRCDGGASALHGKIHWSASDTSVPPGPVTPPANLWQPAAGSIPSSGNYVFLQSDAGDFVGQGQTLSYTQVNSVLSTQNFDGYFSMNVAAGVNWDGEFRTMVSVGKLQPGYYGNLQRGTNNPATGGIDWHGAGRGCNRISGWFVIDSVTYVNDILTSIDLRFEQHCEGLVPALHGKIHWASNDPAVPPGPVNPPPSSLWRAPDGATPTSGNYIYLQSDGGDFVGKGQSYTYTQANSVMTLALQRNLLNPSNTTPRLALSVVGDKRWNAEFDVMNILTQFRPGYYGGLIRSPGNPVSGGLSWSGDGRGCNALDGWFVIDSVSYSGAEISAIDLRFEQHCEGAVAALRGQIHWTANDPTTAPPPINPPPANLWRAAAGTTPSSGNYIYLESDAGDFVGQGLNYVYTPATAVIGLSTIDGRLNVSSYGDQKWVGNFQAMNSVPQLEPGYYGNLMRYPSNNPAVGGMDWEGEARGCNKSTDWFVIDSISYVGSVLSTVDLRFEQHCEGMAAALRGQIHWVAADTTPAPGPVYPPPNTLWQPALGATPASGNYVYLQSDTGDFIGEGKTYLYQPSNSIIALASNTRSLQVDVTAEYHWIGQFLAMNSISQLQPGYYPDLMRFAFSNPAKGGLEWGGNGGCNTIQGWFVVDSVSYAGSALDAIDLRFEQHCEGSLPALRGKIHWSAGDTSVPPGPVNPPPVNLWQPPDGVTPTSGNYVYFQSDLNDYIGQGQQYLYGPTNATILISSVDGRLVLNIGGGSNWYGTFQTMISVNKLQPGYYPNLMRYPFQNPAFGGLSWYADSRACNISQGWFVIDNVTYTNGLLSAIDARFEHRCEARTPALRGKIHWTG